MRAIIVEDDEIDRLNLATLLEDHPEIVLAGGADRMETAVELIDSLKPELVFLDIHLGRQRGFKVLESIRHEPLVILTTSHPQYAVDGFSIGAVDYLLKPVMPAALARALSRLPRRVAGHGERPSLELEDIQLFRRPGMLEAVPVSRISAITGERIYSRVLLQDGRDHLHNRTLREWRELLPERFFKTLDRSTIVNLMQIHNVVECAAPARHRIHFHGDSSLEIGETAMRTLRSLM